MHPTLAPGPAAPPWHLPPWLTAPALTAPRDLVFSPAAPALTHILAAPGDARACSRQQLVPMHYSLASAAYSTGRPWFRPLLFDFPEDSNVDDFTDQWMDGDSLMVAPVMNQDNSSNVYLPAGTWFEYNSTTTHAGPSSINTTGVALDHIPMYVKAGGILPHGPVKQYADAASTAPLVVQVYPGADGTFSLVEDDGATTDYTLGAQKTTVFTWTDSTKTLSWESSGVWGRPRKDH